MASPQSTDTRRRRGSRLSVLQLFGQVLAQLRRLLLELRGKLARVPGANLFLAPVQDIRIGGRQSNASWQYTLQADDLADLRTWEPRIRRALMDVKEITDVNTDQQDKGLQTTLVIDRDKAKALGISERDRHSNGPMTGER